MVPMDMSRPWAWTNQWTTPFFSFKHRSRSSVCTVVHSSCIYSCTVLFVTKKYIKNVRAAPARVCFCRAWRLCKYVCKLRGSSLDTRIIVMTMRNGPDSGTNVLAGGTQFAALSSTDSLFGATGASRQSFMVLSNPCVHIWLRCDAGSTLPYQAWPP
jgi:hypothetical protein